MGVPPIGFSPCRTFQGKLKMSKMHAVGSHGGMRIFTCAQVFPVVRRCGVITEHGTRKPVPDLVQSAWAGLDLAWWEATAAVAVVLLGATISGLTGFGFGLVIVPFMLLLFEPPTVVVLTAALAIASSIPILVEDRALIRVRIVSPLLAPALIGSFAGVRILTSLDPPSSWSPALWSSASRSWSRGVSSSLASARVGADRRGLLERGAGLVDGMSGPPVVLFLTDRARNRAFSEPASRPTSPPRTWSGSHS